MSGKIITLSGSMRFYEEIIKVAEELSMNGDVVLAPFKDPNGDKMTDEARHMHNALHALRINMSNKLFVVNKDGYIGKSTKNEIVWALKTHKEVEFMEKMTSMDQWTDILSRIDGSSIVQCIAPTLRIMIEKLISAVKKSAESYPEKFDFTESCRNIHNLQMELLVFYESLENRLKGFDDELDRCEFEFDSIIYELANNIPDDTDWIYSTTSELINLFLEK